MKTLSENDANALINALAELNCEAIKDRAYDGEPYAASVDVLLVDAEYSLHLEATFVPRGAMVISPSCTPVQGPKL